MKSKNEKKASLLDSKKFNITITVINLTLIVILVGYILIMYTNVGKKANNESLNGATKIDEVSIEQLMSQADESMLNVYRVLLAGSTFEHENGMVFSFGLDGSFSGYFDDKNQSVESYSYDVVPGESNVVYLKIMSSDKKQSVQWEMSFDDGGNILIAQPNMEPLRLEY